MSAALPTILPVGWVMTRLEEICNHITDGTHKTPDYRPSGVRFISIKNIQPFSPVDWNAYVRFISEDEHRELTKRCKPEFDDVVFPRIGTLGFAKRVDFTEEVSLFVGLGLLKPERGAILPKYLEYFMNTPWIDRLSHERANGTGRLTLPLEETRRLPVLLAPLNEQLRIADALDELFSDLDAGVEALERVREKLKLYRASVLKAAVEGALNAEWRRQHPYTEPASELLKRVLAERRHRWEEDQLAKFNAKGQEPPQNWKAKYQEPVAPDTTNLPPLPKGWRWMTLNEAAWSASYGTSEKCREINKGLAVLRIPNIIGGRLDLNDLKFAPSDYCERDEDLVRVGDLLVVRTNGSRNLIGRGAVVRDQQSVQLSFASYLIRLRLIPNSALLHWASLIWDSFHVRRWIETRAATSAGQYNITLGVLKELIVPLPPLAEQEAIVETVEDQLSVIEHLEADLDAKLKNAQALRQAILRHAFTGQLVPQNPNDEPASELLKRIASEREARARDTGRKPDGPRKRKRRAKRGGRLPA